MSGVSPDFKSDLGTTATAMASRLLDYKYTTERGTKSIANDEKLQIRISKDLKKQLQEQAQKENRTLSNYILNVLQKELEKNK